MQQVVVISYQHFRTTYRSHLLDPWKWDQSVVSKCLVEIATTLCVITWKSTVLIYSSGRLNSNMKLFQVHVCICHTRDCLHILRAIVRHWKLMHDVFCSSRMPSLPNNHTLQHMASITIGPYECFYICSVLIFQPGTFFSPWLVRVFLGNACNNMPVMSALYNCLNCKHLSFLISWNLLRKSSTA